MVDYTSLICPIFLFMSCGSALIICPVLWVSIPAPVLLRIYSVLRLQYMRRVSEYSGLGRDKAIGSSNRSVSIHTPCRLLRSIQCVCQEPAMQVINILGQMWFWLVYGHACRPDTTYIFTHLLLNSRRSSPHLIATVPVLALVFYKYSTL